MTKLKNLEKHPYHSDMMTHQNFAFYDFQKELIIKTGEYFELQLIESLTGLIQFRPTVDDSAIGSTLHQATLDTGDGKSTCTPYIIREMALRYDKVAKENPGKLYPVGCFAIITCLTDIMDDHKGDIQAFCNSEFGKDFVLLMGDNEGYKNVPTIRDYAEKKLNIPKGKHIIMIFTHQWLSNPKNKLMLISLDTHIHKVIDEAKGIMYMNSEEAHMEGDRLTNKTTGKVVRKLTWANNIQLLGGFNVILNATQSRAQDSDKFGHFKLIQLTKYDLMWKRPWLAESVIISSHKSEIQKKEIMKEQLEEQVKFELESNLLLDEIVKRYPTTIHGDSVANIFEAYRQLKIMIKCSRNGPNQGVTVEEAESRIKQWQTESIGKELRITDFANDKMIDVPCLKDYMSPMIKDQTHKNSISDINNSLYKNNILLVCELGTYGINIKLLTLLMLMRDTLNRNKGKDYTIEQLFGRLLRNIFNDVYFLCDLLISINPLEKDFDFVKRGLMNIARKKLVMFDEAVNRKGEMKDIEIHKTALENFKQKLPNESEYSNLIDNILLEDFKWIPKKEDDMIRSDGKNAERLYFDKRDSNCPYCDNAEYNVHYDKLISEGYGPMKATILSIKHIMENSHNLKRDDGTQESICHSCHKIVTLKFNHHLAYDNPKRKPIKNEEVKD